MQLTKYAHACVALEKDGSRIVLDPGTFTPDAKAAVTGAAAVLITHEHFDHFDDSLLAAALDDDPELRIFGPRAVLDKLGSHGGRVQILTTGDDLSVGGFTVGVHGDRHATIHADIPCVDNLGYLIDETLFHPGDAYFVPEAPLDTLLLPTSGPWTKLGEAADYLRAVKPRRVIQIHELMLSELGQTSTRTLLAGLTGIEITVLPPGQSIDL
ncbi:MULTISPECIES: MBL fold metallo-hydrolase [Nocardia]|uniref:MBL fold metallo-hydrolase n=1 Tax=Nocardia TaxID=1817 RepID=UPI0007EBD8EC|nr:MULTISPECIES: MBL fold metallo-hydrolase [Nocardia]MBF6277848.1 MBL fold metallo-hydrolase [Nocardia nova]OBA51558.1 MBL fold metallo-hydrolase [Nocardia sp. 852002-51101_SCH5132738]OBB46949.1 MBL fold metallo-hydrolase [Nocardia sp. 852002-51244_SCH5132740]OBF72317.1 MBL fold metallo-hydrolase [Mycobacterium sp. 852002-51759_SCH5129042]